MFPCPTCDTPLTEYRLSSGCCPQCGTTVKQGTSSGTPSATLALPPGGITDSMAAPSLEAEASSRFVAAAPQAPGDWTSQTAVAGALHIPEEQPPGEPDSAAAANSSTVLRRSDAEEAQLSNLPTVIRRSDAQRAEDPLASLSREQQVDKLWRGTYTPGSSPQRTIKGSGLTGETARPVVIKPRIVRSEGSRPSAAFTGGAPDYELLEIIGEGGVGVVYAARQTSVNRTVAVKMLRSFAARDADSRDKFLIEAAVTGELDHPNIVPIYDLGTDEAGAMFYSMKRVEGTPWSAAIRQKPLTENLEILMKAADAIAFAHARGVVHRDLKPENVMLGNFGEVLVMDWGIALSTSVYLRHGTVTQSNSMGGTPAYMAPEMATGPLTLIGPRSDVYLLGALLFEIVTGLTPHTGRDVLDCLHAAARNEIQPTDKTGELLDIAYRAMATDIESRYASVHDFQQALREYQSHSESVALAARAEDDLEAARQSRDYQQFARALFAYQEALALWPENTRAARGLLDAQLAYAEAAYEKSDFDLGLSVLDETQRAHRALRRRLLAAQHERHIRQIRMRNIRRTAVSLAVAIIVVLAVGMVLIQNQKHKLDLANTELQSQQTQLMNQQKQLLAQQHKLQVSHATLDQEQARLKLSNEQLEQQKAALSNTNQQLALAKQRADAEARSAREQEQRAEQASYVAQIGLAAAQIEENAFLDARRTIAAFEQAPRSQWRHWEWGRLDYLCERAAATVSVAARVECADLSADGRWLLMGLANSELALWQDGAPQPIAVWKYASPALSLAIAPGRSQFAVSHHKASGAIDLMLFDAEDSAAPPTLVCTLAAHTADVVSLTFSADGGYLLSSSLDQTAILWEVATGKVVQSFRGHFGPVWDAAISIDNKHVYTAGDDHTVGIWDAVSGERIKRFRGHQGPVYTLAVTSHRDAGQRWVVSGGADRFVLAWQPNAVQPFDYERLQRKLTRVGGRVGRNGEDAEQPIRVLFGHTAEVRALAISQDNQYVVSGSHDNTVRVWELAGQQTAEQPYRTLRGHGGWVRFAAFSPEGSTVVSAGDDQQVKRWNVSSYAETVALKGHDDAVLDAVFSPDGTRILTVGRDQKAIVWDAQQGASIRVLEEGHEFLTSNVALFPAGSDKLATSAGDGTTILWDVRTATELQKLSGTGQNSVLAIAPLGDWLFTGNDGNEVLAWPVTTSGVAGPPQELAGHGAPVSVVAFASPRADAPLVAYSGDIAGGGILWKQAAGSDQWSRALRIDSGSGQAITAAHFLPGTPYLLTASADHTLRVWDITTGKEEITKRQRFDGPVKLLELLPGGKQVVLMFTDRKDHSVLCCWDLQQQVPRQQTTVTERVFSLAPASSGDAVLFATDNSKNALWRWDTASGRITPFWATHSLPATIWAARFLPGDAQIVTVGGNVARIWDVATGRRQQSLGPHGPVLACAIAPGGQLAATAGQEGSIKIWNLEEGRVVVKLPPLHLSHGRTQPIHGVYFSPRPAAARSGAAAEYDANAQLLLSVGAEGTARLWWICGTEFREGDVLRSDGTAVLGAAFSPDGQYVATASADGTARLWNAASGNLLRELAGPAGHRLAVNAVAFSHDGRLLATASDDNTAILWDAATGERVRRLTGHTAGVTGLAFSPDARRLITASKDGSAKLWDCRDGGEILTLKGHSAELTTARFSPDGRAALTAGLDAMAQVWPSSDVPPALILQPDPLVYDQPSVSRAIDEEADFTDPDNGDFTGAELFVALTGSAVEGLTEQLLVRHVAIAADGIAVAPEQRTMVRDKGDAAGAAIASWDQPTPATLRFRFTAAAKHADIAAVVRRLEYVARWQAPLASDRTVELRFSHDDDDSTACARRVIRLQSTTVELSGDYVAARRSSFLRP